MLAVQVDGGATDECGGAAGVKDFEVKLAFEFDDKDVVSLAVGWIASCHAYEGVGRGGDEELVQIPTKVFRGDGDKGSSSACAGSLAYPVLHALK